MKSLYAIFTSAVIIFILLTAPIAAASALQGPLKQEINKFDFVTGNSQPLALSKSGSSNGLFQSGVSESDIFTYDKKSPEKAFFLSLLVPGAGEFYAKSKYKPYFFFGADVMLWTGYAIYHNKGHNGEGDYRDYADAHYIRENYDQWWANLIANNPDTASFYSHRLPPTNNYEYYENLGKYDQFVIGWDDYVQGATVYTPHREHYLDMRAYANNQFSKATTLMIVSMVNHVVSGFDAAFTAKAHNAHAQSDFLGEVRIRMVPRTVDDEIYPQLTFYKIF